MNFDYVLFLEQESEINGLNNKISDIESESNEKDSKIEKLENDILSMKTRQKQENEQNQSSSTIKDDEIKKLKQQIKG